jgi:hypothetical protein
MVIQRGSITAGNFDIDMVKDGLGLMTTVTHRKSGKGIEVKLYYSNIDHLKKQIVDLASLYNASEHDNTAIRKAITAITGTGR